MLDNGNGCLPYGLAEGLAPLLGNITQVNANPRLMKRFSCRVPSFGVGTSLRHPVGSQSPGQMHLLERCDEALQSELASKVTSADEGRGDALRVAEQTVREGARPPLRSRTSSSTRSG